MSHVNHRRANPPVQRRRANPNGGESGCGCHPTEFGKPAALGKSRWKRRDSRRVRRVGKQALAGSGTPHAKNTHRKGGATRWRKAVLS